MTAATFTFTLSAAQSSASSMVVAMRAKTGSSIPGNASRWAGGVMPQITLDWAAGVLQAQGTVNTAGNTAVDGNAEYEWYKVSSTPSDLTLDTSALPTVTIVDDDTSGGGGGGGTTVLYGPTSTTDTGPVNGGTGGYRLETTLYDTAYIIDVLGDDNTGLNGYRFKPIGSNGRNIAGYNVGAGGAESVAALQENMTIDYTGPGVPLVVEVTATGAIKLTVNGKVVKGQYQNEDYYSPRGTLSSPAPWSRARTGSGTPRTVTVTKQ